MSTAERTAPQRTAATERLTGWNATPHHRGEPPASVAPPGWTPQLRVTGWTAAPQPHRSRIRRTAQRATERMRAAARRLAG